jgi:hypothetical protein
MDFTNKNVVLRIVKPYPDARAHVYAGQIVSYDGNFLAFDGIVMHHGKPSGDDPTGGLTLSSRTVRWVPLERVEYIRELPEGTNPFEPEAFEVTGDGGLNFPATDRPDLIPD